MIFNIAMGIFLAFIFISVFVFVVEELAKRADKVGKFLGHAFYFIVLVVLYNMSSFAK